jgi:hypothetical protein
MSVQSLNPVFVAGLMALSFARPAFATQDTAGYVTEFNKESPAAVYRSIDGAGRVTYSMARPNDSVAVRKIAIEPGPAGETIEDNRQRYDRIRKTSLELAKAREQRQAEREEKERKRLEWLALQRSASPPAYERTVYVGWRPLWWHYPGVGRYHKWPQRPQSASRQIRGPLYSTPLLPGKRLK